MVRQGWFPGRRAKSQIEVGSRSAGIVSLSFMGSGRRCCRARKTGRARLRFGRFDYAVFQTFLTVCP